MKLHFLAHRQRFKYMEVMVVPRLLRSSLLIGFFLAVFVAHPLFAQEWFRTGTGLGVEKPRVAVADFAAKSDGAKSHSALFTQVVRDDLGFSGILDVVSSSFYPTSQPSIPSELRYIAWTDSPLNAHFIAFGNLTETPGEVAIQAWFYDVTNPSSQAVIAKIYRGTPTDPQVRKRNHHAAFGRTARYFFHHHCFCQFAWRRKRDLGDGLRRRKSACADFPALDFANAALVTGYIAHRFHLLRNRRWWTGQSASVYVLGGRG